jgi:hypothetical protein
MTSRERDVSAISCGAAKSARTSACASAFDPAGTRPRFHRLDLGILLEELPGDLGPAAWGRRMKWPRGKRREIAAALGDAGFSDVRTETFELEPAVVSHDREWMRRVPQFEEPRYAISR